MSKLLQSTAEKILHTGSLDNIKKMMAIGHHDLSPNYVFHMLHHRSHDKGWVNRPLDERSSSENEIYRSMLHHFSPESLSHHARWSVPAYNTITSYADAKTREALVKDHLPYMSDHSHHVLGLSCAVAKEDHHVKAIFDHPDVRSDVKKSLKSHTIVKKLMGLGTDNHE